MTNRVLVCRLDSLGDVLLAGPAVRAVSHSGAEVWMLCGPQGAPAAALLPGVAGVIVWHCPWISNPAPDLTAEETARFVADVMGRDFAEAIILTSFHQSPLPLALLLRLAGVQRITGASVDYAGALLDHRLRPGEDFSEDQPEAERALAIAAAAGYQLETHDGGELRMVVPTNVANQVEDRFDLTGEVRPNIILHPGASAPSRTWAPEHYRETIQLLDAAGVRTFVTGGSGERELTRFVADGVARDLGGRLDLAELGALIQGADLIITGNTGPAHVAAAVGTPVVSLFSPVVPAVRWAPYKVPTVLLGDQNEACAGSRRTTCPVPGHPCLNSVPPASVVAAAFDLIGSIERQVI